MTVELLSIPFLGDSLSEQAMIYLRENIKEEDRIGVSQFVSEQSKLYNRYASHLAAVLWTIENAPESLGLRDFERSFIEWLRANGVSSSRVTQLKAAIRLKTRALGHNSHYSEEEKAAIKGLEVEKAYLFGRLSFRGQEKGFEILKESGKLTLNDLRNLVKEHEYEPQWKSQGNRQADKPHTVIVQTKHVPFSENAHDLLVSLQHIVDELLDIRPQWEGDHRLAEVINQRRLQDLSSYLCKGLDQWDDF